MPLPLERWQIQEDAIYSLCEIAMQPGGALAVQSNQDGTHGIQLLERVAPPAQGVFPCIGIQCSGYKEAPFGNRAHVVEATFDIALVVQTAYDVETADTLLAARMALRNYVNDGNGNGLSALLRANPTLLGNCELGWIDDLQMAILTPPGQAAGAIATAIYTYKTRDQVGF